VEKALRKVLTMANNWARWNGSLMPYAPDGVTGKDDKMMMNKITKQSWGRSQCCYYMSANLKSGKYISL
jgi:hypothetical protein